MTYEQATDFLFSQLASYQTQGQKAFNKSLDKTLALLDYLGNPHLNFKSVHVAGTNGKGSSCHMIASILQVAGCKTGLYTSPHLKRFTERIKINGVEVDENYVSSFVEENKTIIEELKPSFFEMTTAMAFKYFSEQKVDIAIIETGLGGRLDSTNVITPLVSLITSIGLDHQQILGDTIEEIAKEKGGIIKKGIPVVLGVQKYNTVDEIIRDIALENNSKLVISGRVEGEYKLDLKGNYQKENLAGVLNVIAELKNDNFNISDKSISDGLSSVVKNNSLKGRWQILSINPLTICDTAHNIDGLKFIVNQIEETDFNKLFIVFGMVNDKDFKSVLELLPKYAKYIFTKPSNDRALSEIVLKQEAEKLDLQGVAISDVNKAIEYCKKKASKNDMIYVGGSTFVVADIDEL